MRTLSSITLALFTSLLAGGCLAPAGDPADDDLQAHAADLTTTPAPRCPDTHADLPAPSRSCTLHDGSAGVRLCVDHLTIHYVPLIGGPPDFKLTCVQSGTDVTTTCGPCAAILLP
jgi:hypothetical protein